MLSYALLQFPACIANLNAGLTHVNTDTLTLKATIPLVKRTPRKTLPLNRDRPRRERLNVKRVNDCIRADLPRLVVTAH